MKRISAQLHITKKIFILICLSILAVIMLIIGIYLLIKNDNKNKPQYNIDKYSDVVNWCNSSVSGSDLSIDCKALLLNIDTKEDGTSCFDVQVISNSNELKNLTVCEKGGSLTYTNEVLGYKKLMPIDIVFSYSQDSNVLKKSYSFTNVSFKEMDESYIQNIVNNDIANLVTLDPSSTTIKNSVDFCPNPSKLPSYVAEENKQKYTEFFNKNIMDKNDYTNQLLYSWDDSTIRILFACDSAENMGYTDICNTNNQNLEKILTQKLYPSSNVGYKLETKDISLIKELSIIYDSILFKNSFINIKYNFEDISNLINSSNSINYNVLNTLEHIYSFNSNYNDTKDLINNISLNFDIHYFRNINNSLNTNIVGLFIFNHYMTSDKTFDIYNRCSNLSYFMNHL